MTLEKVSFDLHQIASEVKKSQSSFAQSKKIHLQLDFPSQIPRVVTGDPTRVRQILTNLVNNAIKFTSIGSVTLKIQTLANDQGFRFEITDTGIGLREEALSRLFHPFTQADNSTTRRFGGTGLGLSICKQLVEMMNGRIGVTSQPSQGSTFWFELPLPISEHKKIQSSPPSQLSKTSTCALAILIADDNVTNQLVATQMVKRLGHRSRSVPDGKAVLQALQEEHFDLILMDCHMPGMDGYQATQEIRKSPEAWSQIPIVALTSSAMSEDRDLCFQAGMTGYLAKPMSLAELNEAIESALPEQLKSA